jgi:hypothetical protein
MFWADPGQMAKMGWANLGHKTVDRLMVRQVEVMDPLFVFSRGRASGGGVKFHTTNSICVRVDEVSEVYAEEAACSGQQQFQGAEL